MQPLRITFNQACEILSVSRDNLRNLIIRDQSFPRPIKCGNKLQSPVYFDYNDLTQWHEKQKNKTIEVEN